VPIQEPMRILCFGDSNTQGVVPGSEVGFEVRFGVNVRWTGQLHQKLGAGFAIIEEGLMGRVTDFDDPNRIGKNGLAYLQPCLESHRPLDLVILMLGTNDCKERYHRQPEDIAGGVRNLLIKIASLVPQAKILLLAPPLIDETAPGIKVRYLGAEIKSRALGGLLAKLAQDRQVGFLDLAKIVPPSPKDGCHLDAQSHTTVATKIYEKLLELNYVHFT